MRARGKYIVRILNVVVTPLAFVMCTMKGIMEVVDAIMMYKKLQRDGAKSATADSCFDIN